MIQQSPKDTRRQFVDIFYNALALRENKNLVNRTPRNVHVSQKYGEVVTHDNVLQKLKNFEEEKIKKANEIEVRKQKRQEKQALKMLNLDIKKKSAREIEFCWC